MPLRKVVFWVHLACGVGAGLVILMMSVTGVLLTYQKQMTEWSDRAFWQAPADPSARAPISALVRAAEAYGDESTTGGPGQRVTGVQLWSAPDAPVAATFPGGRTVYLDPATAEVRGEAARGVRAFLSWNVRMHRWFGASGDARGLARAVTGWSNLVFLFLVLSGLYLWIPARWTRQHLRPILVLHRSARGRVRDFNWHHVFGFWLAIPLAVVVASATVISFPWASDLAYRMAGEAPPERRVRAAASGVLGTSALGTGAARAPEPVPFDVSRLDPLVGPATARVDGWRTLAFVVPEVSGDALEVRIDRGWGGDPRKRHTVRYDALTGREVAFESFGDQSRGRRFRSFLRFAHTGEYFGIGGQTLAGLASLAGVLLVWTGLALAWRRLVVQPLRRRTTAAA